MHIDIITDFPPSIFASHVLTITDDNSRYYTSIPLRTCGEAANALKRWILHHECALPSRKVAYVHTDNGKELVALELWAAEQGMEMEPSIPFYPMSNGCRMVELRPRRT